MAEANPLDEILNNPNEPQSHTTRASRSSGSGLAGSLGKSMLVSIVRNITGTVTRAVLKSLMGSKKSGGSKSGRY